MKRSILLLIFLALFALNAEAGVKLFNDKSVSKIVYSMHHPLHDWQGISKDVTSVILTDDGEKENIKSVAVTAKVSSFDSDNSNRDSHMIEVTEALLYPSVTFTSNSIEKDGQKIKLNGNLTFHGVSKPVALDALIKNSGDKMEVIGEFDIKMTDFKIEPPSLLGIDTDDDINLKFDIIF